MSDTPFLFQECAMVLGMIDVQKELKKHVSAIHIGGKLSLLQRKLFNVLLFNSYDDLLKKETHEIRIGELCELSGFESNDYRKIKDVLSSLQNTSVTWNLLGDDNVEEWGITSLVSEAVIRKGVCYYSYGPLFRKKLYEPEIYARINLSIMSKFSGSYAFALYENTTRFRSIGSTGWKDLGFWRRVLGVGEGEYRQFKELNKKVIKAAVKEVNETSDIMLEAEYKREKRRIVAIKFNVQRNPQLTIPFPIKDELMKKAKEEMDLEKMEQEAITVGMVSEAYRRMRYFGLTESQADAIQKDHDDEYIMANLNIVKRDYKAGKIEKGLPAYTFSALKKDYRPKKSPVEQDVEQKRKSRKRELEQRRQEKERLEILKKEFEANRIQEALQRMGDSERQRFEERFQKKFEGDLVYKRFQDMGMNHPVVQSLFNRFARNELLTEASEKEINEFINEKDLDEAIVVTS